MLHALLRLAKKKRDRQTDGRQTIPLRFR